MPFTAEVPVILWFWAKHQRLHRASKQKLFQQKKGSNWPERSSSLRCLAFLALGMLAMMLRNRNCIAHHAVTTPKSVHTSSAQRLATVVRNKGGLQRKYVTPIDPEHKTSEQIWKKRIDPNNSKHLYLYLQAQTTRQRFQSQDTQISQAMPSNTTMLGKATRTLASPNPWQVCQSLLWIGRCQEARQNRHLWLPKLLQIEKEWLAFLLWNLRTSRVSPSIFPMRTNPETSVPSHWCFPELWESDVQLDLGHAAGFPFSDLSVASSPPTTLVFTSSWTA